jgi:hypothetical protein
MSFAVVLGVEDGSANVMQTEILTAQYVDFYFLFVPYLLE